MHQPYPVQFNAIPQPRIWGGDKLKQVFNTTRMDEPIGEYWVLSGHPHGTSTVLNGWLAGKNLNELIALFPEAYLGHSPQARFPLLIKFLEAETDLSVQIHPDDSYALEHEGDYGKTEAWYIVECKDGGQVNLGHQFTSRYDYERAVAAQQVKNYLTYRDIQKDQLVYVPARTLHALLAGTVVIEIQQTSDITYRVYDWDRVDNHGQPRALHVDRAADVMKFPSSIQQSEEHLCEVLVETDDLKHERLLQCPYFTLDRLLLSSKPISLVRGKTYSPDIMVMALGHAKLKWQDGEIELKVGDTVLIPTNIHHYEVIPDGSAKILRAFY